MRKWIIRAGVAVALVELGAWLERRVVAHVEHLKREAERTRLDIIVGARPVPTAEDVARHPAASDWSAAPGALHDFGVATAEVRVPEHVKAFGESLRDWHFVSASGAPAPVGTRAWYSWRIDQLLREGKTIQQATAQATADVDASLAGLTPTWRDTDTGGPT